MGNYESTIDRFMKTWLLSTTCRKPGRLHLQWRHYSGRFILVRHNGHSERVSRGQGGTVTCKTYRALYDLKNIKEDRIHLDNLSIKEWFGRWKKSYMQEVDAIISSIIEKD